MKAVGIITGMKSAYFGFPLVNLYVFDHDKEIGQLTHYCLTNEDKIPIGHPNFALFEFEPADQFCRWVDVNNA